MALASNVTMRFSSGSIPLLQGALECVRAGYVPGGLKNNRDFAECLVALDDAGVPDDIRTLSIRPPDRGRTPDPVATPDGRAPTSSPQRAAVPAVEIGEVYARTVKPTIYDVHLGNPHPPLRNRSIKERKAS